MNVAQQSAGGGGGAVGTPNQEFDGPAVGGTIVGVRNGINKVYTLSHVPLAGTLLIWISGGNPLIGGGVDYTLVGAVVTLAAGTPAPLVTDTIFTSYSY